MTEHITVLILAIAVIANSFGTIINMRNLRRTIKALLAVSANQEEMARLMNVTSSGISWDAVGRMTEVEKLEEYRKERGLK